MEYSRCFEKHFVLLCFTGSIKFTMLYLLIMVAGNQRTCTLTLQVQVGLILQKDSANFVCPI